jgi:uncharacterized protein YggL (DUF469 family)
MSKRTRARQRRISDAPRRSRRLRKKLRVGEFRQQGFELAWEFVEPLYVDAEAQFWDALIFEAIEANGLLFGGSNERAVVDAAGRASVTEAQRAAVEAWLRARPEVASVRVGPLADLNTLDDGGPLYPTR